jgi:hypothetical protein
MAGMNELNEWLAHCERLHPKTIDMGLERVQAVAQRMGLRFECPVVTVAGTNGKGSTCAMLEAIALQAGWRTGVYTSPHLVPFRGTLPHRRRDRAGRLAGCRTSLGWKRRARAPRSLISNSRRWRS